MGARYRLVASGYRRTLKKRDEDKDIRTRFRKGDILEDLYPEEVTRLLRLGAIVDEDEEDPESVHQQSVPDIPHVPEVLDDDDTRLTVPEANEADGTDEDGEGQGDGTEASTDYESMEYPRLQHLAKERTGNGGGSKADLVERLIEHDREQEQPSGGNPEDNDDNA